MDSDAQLQDLLDQYAKQTSKPTNDNTTSKPEAIPSPISPGEIGQQLEVETQNKQPPPPPIQETTPTTTSSDLLSESVSIAPPTPSPSDVGPPPPLTPLSQPTFSTPIKPPFNFFKFTFFLSLLLFLGVFGFLGYNLIVGGARFNLSSVNPQVTPILPTPIPTTMPQITCLLNDQTMQVGDTFPATDGCNTCTCSDDSSIICTQETCPSEIVETQKTYSRTTTPKYQVSYPGDWTFYTYVSSPDTVYFEPVADEQEENIRPELIDTEPPIVPLTIAIIDSTATQSLIQKNKQDYKYSGYSQTSPTINGVRSISTKGLVETESYLSGLIDHHLYIPRGNKTIHLNFIELDSEFNETLLQQVSDSLSW